MHSGSGSACAPVFTLMVDEASVEVTEENNHNRRRQRVILAWD